jgi:hypothetical protein
LCLQRCRFTTETRRHGGITSLLCTLPGTTLHGLEAGRRPASNPCNTRMGGGGACRRAHPRARAARATRPARFLCALPTGVFPCTGARRGRRGSRRTKNASRSPWGRDALVARFLPTGEAYPRLRGGPLRRLDAGRRLVFSALCFVLCAGSGRDGRRDVRRSLFCVLRCPTTLNVELGTLNAVPHGSRFPCALPTGTFSCTGARRGRRGSRRPNRIPLPPGVATPSSRSPLNRSVYPRLRGGSPRRLDTSRDDGRGAAVGAGLVSAPMARTKPPAMQRKPFSRQTPQFPSTPRLRPPSHPRARSARATRPTRFPCVLPTGARIRDSGADHCGVWIQAKTGCDARRGRGAAVGAGLVSAPMAGTKPPAMQRKPFSRQTPQFPSTPRLRPPSHPRARAARATRPARRCTRPPRCLPRPARRRTPSAPPDAGPAARRSRP